MTQCLSSGPIYLFNLSLVSALNLDKNFHVPHIRLVQIECDRGLPSKLIASTASGI